MLAPRQHLRDSPPRRPATSDDTIWLRLHRNERVDCFSPAEREAMLSAIPPQALVRYPDAEPVVSVLAASLGVPADAISLFAGSESAIRTLYDVMVEPGDVVLGQKAGYRGYAREAFAHRAAMTTVGYDATMRLDTDALLEAVRLKRPRLVFLGNPDALGRPLSRHVVAGCLTLLERTGGMLVVDEAYHYFGAASMRDLVSHPQLVVLRTFSKAWGLAGLRCGHVIASADVVRIIERVKLRNEVSGVTLAMLSYALEHAELRDDYTSAVVAARSALAAELAALGFEPIPSQANFIVARVPAVVDPAWLQSAARERGIAIAVMMDAFIRVTVGRWAQMEPFVRFLRAVIPAPARATED